MEPLNGLVIKESLSEADLGEIRRLEAECNRYDGIEVKLNWEMMQRRAPDEKGDFCYYRDGTLVGYAPLDSFGDMFELTAIVRPDLRRQGIFQEMFQAAFAESQLRQARQLLLVSYKASPAGTAVAARYGQYQSSEYRMRAEAENMPMLPANWLELLPVGPAELPELSRLLGLAFEPEQWNSVASLGEQLAGGDGAYWLAKLNDRYIGQIGTIEEGDSVYIRAVGIDPTYRGQGYGRQLLAGMLQQLLGRGFRRFELDVATRNDTALTLYQSCGFHEVNVYDYYEVALNQLPAV